MAENIEVKSETANPLFGRREIVAEMRAEGATPSRKQVLKLLADKLGAAEDCIVVEKIKHPYGTRKIALAFSVYENAEQAKKEPAYKLERGGRKKKAGSGEKEAGKKEEKPEKAVAKPEKKEEKK